MIDTRLNKECPCDCDKGCELEEMTQDGYWFCLGSKCEMLVRADERERVLDEVRNDLLEKADYMETEEGFYGKVVTEKEIEEVIKNL